MSSPTLALDHQDSLQKQAIENTRLAFSRLPGKDAFFQQCIGETDSLPEIVKSLMRKYRAYEDQKSMRIIQRFHGYTIWLHNISDVVDIAVQTQAGIACPLWAPIKFVLKASKNHSQAAETILRFIETISENLPRFDIYQRLQSEHVLQIALLNIFTDVVEFSVLASNYFKRRTLVRVCKSLLLPFEAEFGDILDRVKKHSKIVDSTAVATEMLKAAEFRNEMAQKEQENLKIQCESWLKPPNVRAIHQSQVQARLQGTCNWIWLNSAFQQWKQLSPTPAPERLLCISGTHGCGKSVLASSILEGLNQQTLFFSFSGTDTSRQSFSSLVRSFIWQSLQGNAAEKGLEIIKPLMMKGQPLVSELWASFMSLVALAQSPVYCIIDGIDECCDPGQTILDHILELLSSQADFRVLLLGRPFLFRTLKELRNQTIEIDSDMTKQDIDAYIDAEIGKHDIFRSPRLRDMVVESLKDRSEGMFLWVKLMVDYLRKSDTLAQVEERLRDLPRSIEKAYRIYFNRLLEQLDPYEIALAKNVFTLTITSLRPLEIEEFRLGLAIRSGYSVSSKDALLMEPERKILAVSGGLINISNGVIYPIHFSLKEYLLRPEEEWLGSDESRIIAFRVDFQASHHILGSICVDYLTLCDYGSPLSGTDHFLQLGNRYSLLKYASLYAVSHLNRSGPPCPVTMERIREFLKSEKFPPWIEYIGMLKAAEASIITLFDETERFMSWLDKGGYKEELLKDDFLRRLNQELESRTRQYGKQHPRTEQCQLFLDLLQGNTSGSDADNDRVYAPEKVNQQITSIEPSNLNVILNALQRNSELPLHRGVDMFLRLQHHLLHVKILTHPLKMLFHIILQKAPIIPVYVLIAIGDAYERFKKKGSALEIFRAALAKVESQEIPIRFHILSRICDVLIEQEKYEEAEIVCRQALKLGQRVFGKENENTLWSAHELAYILGEQGKYEEAEVIYKSTLKSRQEVLGLKHEYTLMTAHNLSMMLHGQGKLEESEVLCRQTLESQQRSLGPNHEDTVGSITSLSWILFDLGQYDEAEVLCVQALESAHRMHREDVKFLLDNASRLAHSLAEQHKYKKAEALYRQMIVVEEKVLEKKHTVTARNGFTISLRTY